MLLATQLKYYWPLSWQQHWKIPRKDISTLSQTKANSCVWINQWTQEWIYTLDLSNDCFFLVEMQPSVSFSALCYLAKTACIHWEALSLGSCRFIACVTFLTDAECSVTGLHLAKSIWHSTFRGMAASRIVI